MNKTDLINKYGLNDQFFEPIYFKIDKQNKFFEFVIVCVNNELINLIYDFSYSTYRYLPEMMFTYKDGTVDQRVDYIHNKSINITKSVNPDVLYEIVHVDKNDSIIHSLSKFTNQSVDRLNNLSKDDLYDLVVEALESELSEMHRLLIAETHKLEKNLVDDLNQLD